MDELGINRGFSPHFSPSRNLSGAESQQQQLYIHLPNHGFRIIRIDEAADVRTIVNNLVGSMSSSGGAKPNPLYYALRLRHIISKEILWLPLSKFNFYRHVINFLLISTPFSLSSRSSLQQLRHVKSLSTFQMNHARIFAVQISQNRRRRSLIKVNKT